MGNILSGSTGSNVVNKNGSNTFNESETMEDACGLVCNEDENVEEQFHDTMEDDNYEENRSRRKEEELTEFKKELHVKREQRRNILARHKTEKKNLEEALNEERKMKIELLEQNRFLKEMLLKNNIELPENCPTSTEYQEFLKLVNQMSEEMEKLKSNNTGLRLDLVKSNRALQDANSDIADLSVQNTESIKQINALKEVISVSKTMISLREDQLTELKNKLNEIEQSLADREANMLSTDLRQEYERQLHNIRTLRGLYEERARLAEVTKQALVRDLDEQKVLLQAEIKKNEKLNTKVDELEAEINKLQDSVDDKNSIIQSCHEECRGLQSEMSVVNKLFSQVLLGYKTKKDLDKLVTRLEENHGILTHMAEKENGSEGASALPKLLLELVSQMEENDICNDGKSEESALGSVNGTESEVASTSTPEEIVQNLPKVWRVLMELLSHQSESDNNSTEKVTTCYKSVQTKSGPVLVPSVSQTYIRLKDLIVEKLALIKEVNRMKQLNTHLASRLHDQEKRLCSVTNELSKTWHVVGRLRRHHQQLHTHEKILKYELQQKRKLLNELKEELEYCREKWEQAREKNSQSERDWKKLRVEFSNRKLKPESMSLNNSAESGYSDERPSDESSGSNDESEYVIETKNKYKKKGKKSFETAPDTSTDLNLAAEREDPVSDTLDVADLSLDTQDENHEVFDQSDACERVVETEDECPEIAHDILSDEISATIKTENMSLENVIQTDTTGEIATDERDDASTSTQTLTDPATILKNIQQQNVKLAGKDKQLSELEKDSAALLDKTQSVSKLGDIIDRTLDNLINKPTASTSDAYDDSGQQLGIQHEDKIKTDNTVSTSERDKLRSDTNSVETKVVEVDFKAILQNIKRQDERLQKKEERLQNLEQNCSNVVSDISSTIKLGDNMISKLDTLHSNRNKKEGSNSSESDITDTSTCEPGPSTSYEMDHEARFAARDERLKRLEEQTKSLVNTVNKTKTKGVKIHYKLEELHNIYGADSSRSGTPSEDTEDTSKSTDDASQEEEME